MFIFIMQFGSNAVAMQLRNWKSKLQARMLRGFASETNVPVNLNKPTVRHKQPSLQRLCFRPSSKQYPLRFSTGNPVMDF